MNIAIKVPSLKMPTVKPSPDFEVHDLAKMFAKGVIRFLQVLGVLAGFALALALGHIAGPLALVIGLALICIWHHETRPSAPQYEMLVIGIISVVLSPGFFVVGVYLWWYSPWWNNLMMTVIGFN